MEKLKRGSVYDTDYVNPYPSRPSKYKNYAVKEVDGKTIVVESSPVARSLASEYSTSMNAVTREGNRPLRGRMNVDAVDLSETISKLK